MGRLITRPRTPVAAELLRPKRIPFGKLAIDENNNLSKQGLVNFILPGRDIIGREGGYYPGTAIALSANTKGATTRFNGTTSHVQPGAWEWARNYSGNFTIIAGFTQGTSGADDWQEVFSNQTTGITAYFRLLSGRQSNAGKIIARLWGTAYNFNISTGATAAPVNEYNEVAVVKSGATGIAYNHGVQIGTNTGTNQAVNPGSNQSWSIGRDKKIDQYYFDGEINFIAIFLEALAEREIRQFNRNPEQVLKAANSRDFIYQSEIPPVTGEDNAILMASNF